MFENIRVGWDETRERPPARMEATPLSVCDAISVWALHVLYTASLTAQLPVSLNGETPCAAPPSPEGGCNHIQSRAPDGAVGRRSVVEWRVEVDNGRPGGLS
jgi:hypothetical protein